ncbi:hypothetical protein BN1723_010679 [Verticillium longisporum]|nr:hypothetical protein BN1723_010679 [Verticillium longisporum]
MPPMDQPRCEEVVDYDADGKLVCYHHKERVCSTCCLNYEFDHGFDFGDNVFDRFAVPVCLPHRRRICHECCCAFSCDTAMGIKTPNSYSVDAYGKLVCAWHSRRVCHVCDIALIYGAPETNSLGTRANGPPVRPRLLEKWMLPERAASERSYSTKASFSTRDLPATRVSDPTKGFVETREETPSTYSSPGYETPPVAKQAAVAEPVSARGVAARLTREPKLVQVNKREPPPESVQTMDANEEHLFSNSSRPRVSIPAMTPISTKNHTLVGESESHMHSHHAKKPERLPGSFINAQPRDLEPSLIESRTLKAATLPSTLLNAPSRESTPECKEIPPWRDLLNKIGSIPEFQPGSKNHTVLPVSDGPGYDSWDADQSSGQASTPPLKWPSSNYCEQCEVSWLCVREDYVTEHPLHNSCKPIGSKSDFAMKARTLIVNFSGLMPQGEKHKLGGAGVFFGPSSVYNRSEILSDWYTSPQSAMIEAARMAVQDVRECILPRRDELIENRCQGEVVCQLRDAKPFRLILVSDTRTIVDMMTTDIKKWRYDREEQVYINRKGGTIRNSLGIFQLAREMELLTETGVEIQWHYTKQEFNHEAVQLAQDAVDRARLFDEADGTSPDGQNKPASWQVVTWAD